MFILRIVEKESITNIAIGDNYEVGRKGSVIFDEFVAVNDWVDSDNIKCVIETPHHDGIHIENNQEAYIMTNSGQTFEKL
jgi:hypothetical protein